MKKNRIQTNYWDTDKAARSCSNLDRFKNCCCRGASGGAVAGASSFGACGYGGDDAVVDVNTTGGLSSRNMMRFVGSYSNFGIVLEYFFLFWKNGSTRVSSISVVV
jgi:hypothetical protein